MWFANASRTLIGWIAECSGAAAQLAVGEVDGVKSETMNARDARSGVQSVMLAWCMKAGGNERIISTTFLMLCAASSIVLVSLGGAERRAWAWMYTRVARAGSDKAKSGSTRARLARLCLLAVTYMSMAATCRFLALSDDASRSDVESSSDERASSINNTSMRSCAFCGDRENCSASLPRS